MTHPCGTPKYPQRSGDASLITGASSGIGRELAVCFSPKGHVILSGRNESELVKTRELCGDPHNTSLVCGDLQSTDKCSRLAYLADLYAIRYLVLCAGVYYRGSLTNQSIGRGINQIIDTNTTATIELIRLTFPYLKHGTVVIHINSVAGKNISPEEAVYSASKHAMTGFLRAFRFEAKAKGIRVLDVFLGAVQTPMCADRPGYEKMMSAQEAAKTIYTVATLPLETAQVEELHLGRFLT